MAFLHLWKYAVLVLTSSSLQEETTARGEECLTIRDNIERPVTAEEDWSVLAVTDPVNLTEEAHKVLRGEGKRGKRTYLWDTKAAERMVSNPEREELI